MSANRKLHDHLNYPWILRKSHRPHCAFCRYIGHTIMQCHACHDLMENKLFATEDGHRSPEPTEPDVDAQRDAVELAALIGADNQLQTVDQCGYGDASKLPAIKIDACGCIENAVICTGSASSKASFKLYRSINRCGLEFTETKVSQSDGRQRMVRHVRDSVPVRIGGRVFEIHNLLVMSHQEYGVTTLGAEFLQQAGIVLDMSAGRWAFEDALSDWRLFEE